MVAYASRKHISPQTYLSVFKWEWQSLPQFVYLYCGSMKTFGANSGIWAF